MVPMKLLHISYNICLLEPKCYLSTFASQSQYKCCLGDRPPILGRGLPGGRAWNNVKVLRIRYNLFAGTEMLSLSVYEPIAIQILLEERPSFNLVEGSK